MNDQVQSLKKKGIPAAAIHAGQSLKKRSEILHKAYRKEIKLLYVSPERFALSDYPWYENLPIDLIAIDEAHCISQWGHDFRPAYKKLSLLREAFPKVPIIALTATATPLVKQDIINTLTFREGYKVFETSVYKENLSISVVSSSWWYEHLLAVLKNLKSGGALVYARSRTKTEELASWLRKYGVNAEFYHAGLKWEERKEKQDKWLKGEVPVMVCTTAFGMGIDKPDVRIVMHIDLPEDPESYLQEIGRAGRDGKHSYAILYATQNARVDLLKKISNIPDLDTVRKIYDYLCSHLKISYGEGQDKAFVFNPERFIQLYKINPFVLIEALKILNIAGYIELEGDMKTKALVKVTVSREELYKFRVEHPKWDRFIDTLVRLNPGIMDRRVPLRLGVLAKALSTSTEAINEALMRLHKYGIVEYVPPKQGTMLVFLKDRVPSPQLTFPVEELRRIYSLKKKRAKWMIHFSYELKDCRMQHLATYFNPQDASRKCNKCDNCLNDVSLAKKKILNLLRSVKRPMTAGQIAGQLIPMNEQVITTALEQLVAADSLKVVKNRYFSI
ncbi:MAG: RecQ family ATP-dependent DNA helicase, partial [Chlorobi bacterium]|nr:RecQ family ATP-dependent DNA helicase [Chlorobiota bacterium]